MDFIFFKTWTSLASLGISVFFVVWYHGSEVDTGIALLPNTQKEMSRRKRERERRTGDSARIQTCIHFRPRLATWYRVSYEMSRDPWNSRLGKCRLQPAMFVRKKFFFTAVYTHHGNNIGFNVATLPTWYANDYRSFRCLNVRYWRHNVPPHISSLRR